jgi:hypothetical protein
MATSDAPATTDHAAGRPNLSAPVAFLVAVPLNIMLGIVGILPFAATLFLGWGVSATDSGGDGLWLIVPAVVAVALWWLYVWAIKKTNGAVRRASAVPAGAYWTVCGAALFTSWWLVTVGQVFLFRL